MFLKKIFVSKAKKIYFETEFLFYAIEKDVIS